MVRFHYVLMEYLVKCRKAYFSLSGNRLVRGPMGSNPKETVASLLEGNAFADCLGFDSA